MADGVVIQKSFRPTRYLKNMGAMKAERAVKRITFDRTEANPGETFLSKTFRELWWTSLL